MANQSATLQMNEHVMAERRRGRSILHLGFGEAGLPPLRELVEVLRDSVEDTRYASVAGGEAARDAAAGFWSRRNIPTAGDQIVYAPGSKALLFALMTAVGGDVVLPIPSWVTYAAQASLTGKRVIGVPVPDAFGGIPDPNLLSAGLDHARANGADPRLLVVTLPDNPTGTLADPAAVQEVCEIADREGLVVVSDEIYRDLVHDGRTFASPAVYLPERTIVTSGLSKSLALGGWRIGFARMPASAEGQRWREHVVGIGSEVWSCMSTPMEAVAEWALREPPQVVERVSQSRNVHAKVSTEVFERLRQANLTVRQPTAGFYLYPDFREFRPSMTALGLHTSTAVARYLLDEYGVAILPGTAFGEAPNDLKFRIATSLLYGSPEQRDLTLIAQNPADLPWVRASLSRLSSTLSSLSRVEPGTASENN